MRHATAQKNIEDRHGGPGTKLVHNSIEEIKNAVNKLPIIPSMTYSVVASPVRQAIDTANNVATLLKTTVSISEELRPFGLGVLSGLSREEAQRDFPCTAILMGKWRRGEIEINELIIPHGESITSFYSRGSGSINGISCDKNATIIVSSRSILILLSSILLGRTIDPGGGYKEIPFRNAEFLVFTRFGSQWVLDSKMSFFNRNVLHTLVK
ncbi:histidine phosphatase family protein [Solemya elarraichensis gill symbiont]|uniref:Histidine phosphatase family protein n=1 Tax=Solemya elarraichensis gill symbiont TaxID=1918949 RepID=A0A1T2L019_9GAMM|nr:histidine phosphatase family protein [Solemya elarraichensis gill symbiont]OOZ38457.1 hypothetical protein BOW52_08520 [Solemya elarraichensis gill symbiont]